MSGRITNRHKFWGVSLEEYLFRVSTLIKFLVVKILDRCLNFRGTYFEWLVNFGTSFSQKFVNLRV